LERNTDEQRQQNRFTRARIFLVAARPGHDQLAGRQVRFFAFDEPFGLAALFALGCVAKIVIQVIHRPVLVADLVENGVPAIFDPCDVVSKFVDLAAHALEVPGRVFGSFEVAPEQVRGADLVELLEVLAQSRQDFVALTLLDLRLEFALDRLQLVLEFLELALGALQLLLEAQLFERRNRLFQRFLFFE
jgi:hypothetical protein